MPKITKMMTPARKAPDASTYSGRFAIRLRELREKAGLTVQEVAVRLETTFVTVHNWESGKPTVRLDVLPQLAEMYGLKEVRNLFPKK